MPRIACAVVCLLVLLSGSPAMAAGDRDQAPRFFVSLVPVRPTVATDGGDGILAKRLDLDVRLRTSMIEQPGWLAARTNEVASSLRLFAPLPRCVAAGNDDAETRREPSSLRNRDNSFLDRKVTLQGAVRDGLFLKVSLGVDYELERGWIGRPTPSVGLQFERTFR
jgi:hypothetical protein